MKEKGGGILHLRSQNLAILARLAKIMKLGKKQSLGTIKKQDGTYTNNPAESLEALLDFHFPDRDDNIEAHNIPRNVINNTSLDILENIHKESVKAANCSFKPYKSPGCDGTYPVLLQKGIGSLGEILVKLYKKSIIKGVIPSTWMKLRIAFIPKPGKSDACSPKSFRPITLSSFLLKGLEKIIEQHLNRNFFNRENFFHKNLFSYQEGISTEDALHNIVYRIEKAFEYKQIAVVVFLDIEAAFNSFFFTLKDLFTQKKVKCMVMII